MKLRRPALTVDGVLFQNDSILLIKRKHAPFQEAWALPGGFVEYGEKTEDALIREFFEETHLKIKIYLLLGVYSDPHRDPRGHTITIVYLVDRISGDLVAGDDAMNVKFFKMNALPTLAFDHELIIRDAHKGFEDGVLSKM